MLTAEENELLTRVGPGTPCGEMLRRYWHPVAISSELTDERPKKRVRILGEDLVVFRDQRGSYGLVGEHCSHRGASLYYGFLEDGGLRCPYHGWLYDREGRCVEQPFEPSQSILKHTIRHPAYPVEELGGLLFAYLGPAEKRPLLPRWDILVLKGVRQFEVHPPLSCNWLQCEENTADVTHTYFLHGHMMAKKGLRGGEYYYRPFSQYGFQPFTWGLLKDWVAEGPRGGLAWGNLLVFPNMLRLSFAMHWRVPVDDTHTQIFWLNFTSKESGEGREGEEVNYHGPWLNERGEYPLDSFPSQDTMAWETQGPIFDRTREHLGASDTGVAAFREMVREAIDTVQQGQDPIALVWDPEKNKMIDLREWFREGDDVAGADEVGAPARALTAEEVFDARHALVAVPYGTARPK